VRMRRLPIDPPWLVVPVVGGMVVACLSVLNESWSVAVLWAGAGPAIAFATFGYDRWYERTHTRRPR